MKRFENSIQGIANSMTPAITGGFNLLQGMLNAEAYQQPYERENYAQQRPDYCGETAYRDMLHSDNM